MLSWKKSGRWKAPAGEDSGLGLDYLATCDIASRGSWAAAGSVACWFKQAVATDTTADGDLKQGQTSEASAVVLISDLFNDWGGQALDSFLLSGILGSRRNLIGNRLVHTLGSLKLINKWFENWLREMHFSSVLFYQNLFIGNRNLWICTTDRLFTTWSTRISVKMTEQNMYYYHKMTVSKRLKTGFKA